MYIAAPTKKHETNKNNPVQKKVHLFLQALGHWALGWLEDLSSPLLALFSSCQVYILNQLYLLLVALLLLLLLPALTMIQTECLGRR